MTAEDLPPIYVPLQPVAFMDFTKGGYCNSYHNEEFKITKVTRAETRKSEAVTTFFLDDTEFTDLDVFKVAFFERYPQMIDACRKIDQEKFPEKYPPAPKKTMTAAEFIERCAERGWVLQPLATGGVRIHGQGVPAAVVATLEARAESIRCALLEDLPEVVTFLKWSRSAAMKDEIPVRADSPIPLPDGRFCAHPKAELMQCITHARMLASRHGETGWIQTEEGGLLYATWIALARWWHDQEGKNG